jgi:hypothetical protein
MAVLLRLLLVFCLIATPAFGPAAHAHGDGAQQSGDALPPCHADEPAPEPPTDSDRSSPCCGGECSDTGCGCECMHAASGIVTLAQPVARLTHSQPVIARVPPPRAAVPTPLNRPPIG